MRRGRPPYPDLLTPREQEVLQLLRQGLTNPQIAGRLGISLYGARYHVSEILSKLGVGSREEAAAWQPEAPARSFMPAVAWLSWKRFTVASAGIATLGAALVLSVLLFRDDAAGLGKVAFIRDGSLWVKTLPQGPEQQLTFKTGAMAPQWSPSGEWILYNQGPPMAPDEVGARVVRADGSDERLLESGVVSWSPIEDLLALSLPDSSLVLENADGSGRRQVLAPIAGRGFNPLDRRLMPFWSSDGEWLVFMEHHADHSQAATYAYIGLRAVRVDGSDEQELFAADLSPEGYITGAEPILWLTGWDIGVPAFVWFVPPSGNGPADADGLPLGLMAASPLRSLQPKAAEAMAELQTQEGPGVSMLTFRDYVAVSPDGNTLAMVEGVALRDSGVPGERTTVVDAQTDKRIVLMDLRTADFTRLTGPDIVAVSPSWSPDGEQIAFVARPDTGPADAGGMVGDSVAEQPRRLWSMRSDGSGAGLLRAEGADCRHERPLWSRDGMQLLFVCVSPQGDASLWAVPAGGGTAGRVVDEVSLAITPIPARYGHVSWQDQYDWWQP